MSHLLLHPLDPDTEGREIVGLGCCFALQELSDFQLQVHVGLFQVAHLLQVAAQAVIEVLHGGLLIGRYVDSIAEAEGTASCCRGRGVGGGGLGHTDSRASSAAIHAANPPAASNQPGGGGHGGACDDGALHGRRHVAAVAGEGAHG